MSLSSSQKPLALLIDLKQITMKNTPVISTTGLRTHAKIIVTVVLSTWSSLLVAPTQIKMQNVTEKQDIKLSIVLSVRIKFSLTHCDAFSYNDKQPNDEFVASELIEKPNCSKSVNE